MYKIILFCIKGFPKVLIFEVVRNLRYFARDRTYIYATRLYMRDGKIFVISNNLENHLYMIFCNPVKGSWQDIVFHSLYDIL